MSESDGNIIKCNPLEDILRNHPLQPAAQDLDHPYDPYEEAMRKAAEREQRKRFRHWIALATPAQPAKPEQFVQKELSFAKVPEYTPPVGRNYTDEELAKTLTASFHAPTYYEGIFREVDMLEGRRKSTDDLHKQLLTTFHALDSLHRARSFFLALQKYIDRQSPRYDRFLPETKTALGRIEARVNHHYNFYITIRSKLIAQQRNH